MNILLMHYSFSSQPQVQGPPTEQPSPFYYAFAFWYMYYHCININLNFNGKNLVQILIHACDLVHILIFIFLFSFNVCTRQHGAFHVTRYMLCNTMSHFLQHAQGMVHSEDQYQKISMLFYFTILKSHFIIIPYYFTISPCLKLLLPSFTH